MITYKIKELEKLLGKKIKKNYNVLGVDTASRTGWSTIRTTNKEAILDYGFIHIDSKDKKLKYDTMINSFLSLTTNIDTVIIEDVFLKFNVQVHSFLSRIGMIVYMSAFLNKVSKREFIWATTARKTLGLKGNVKKQDLQKEFKNKFSINIDDEDIIDAIILALYGIISPTTIEE